MADNLADQLSGKTTSNVVPRQPVGRPSGTLKKPKRQTGYDPTGAIKRRLDLLRTSR